MSQDNGASCSTSMSYQRSDGNSEFKVFVVNISYDYDDKELYDVMTKHVKGVTNVKLYKDEKGYSVGCCTVAFKKRKYANRAIQKLTNFCVDRKRLLAFEDKDLRDDSGCKISNGIPTVRQFTTENSFGLNPQYLESLNIQPPLINRVLVTNFQSIEDLVHMRQIFELAGVIIGIQVNKPKNRDPFVLIEYSNPLYAVQAVAMLNKTNVYDIPLSVTLDRFDRGPITDSLPNQVVSVGIGLGPYGNSLFTLDHILPGPMSHHSPFVAESSMSDPSGVLQSLMRMNRNDEDERE